MKKIVKVNSGLIAKEEFSMGLNAPWFLSPATGVINTDSNGLTIYHSVSDTAILKPITEQRCVIDIRNIFNPQNASERAIISIFENEEISLDLEEYFDATAGTTEAYEHFRIIKDYNSYRFLWSNDGQAWNFVGATDIQMSLPMLKIILIGGGNADYILKSVNIYSDYRIQVRNLIEGQKVELYDTNLNLIASSRVTFQKNYADLDISKIESPISGKFKIYDVDGVTEIIDSGLLNNISGGDIYNYTNALTLYDEADAEMFTESETFLGSLEGLSVERKFRLKNDTTAIMENCIVSITQKNGLPDWEKVYVSEDTETLSYLKSINLGNFNPGEEKYFWLKVERNELNPLQNDCVFNLGVSTK